MILYAILVILQTWLLLLMLSRVVGKLTIEDVLVCMFGGLIPVVSLVVWLLKSTEGITVYKK